MAAPTAEKFYVKYAWVLLLVVSVFFVLRGLVAMLTGGSTFDSGLKALTGMGWNQIVAQSPSIATFINGTQYESGLFIFGFGLFGIAVTATGYRRGERSAWYTSWILLLVLLLILPLDFGANVPFASVGPPPGLTVEGGAASLGSGFVVITVILALLTLLGLLLPYRKFFQKK